MAAVARSVLRWPPGNGRVQLAAHAPPTPLTLPRPDTATVSLYEAGPNTAMTFFAASIVTVQEVDPVQSPSQRSSREPAAGAAPTETVAWLSTRTEQAGGHARPFGELKTVPLPPVVEIVSGNCGSRSSQFESCTSHHEPLCP